MHSITLSIVCLTYNHEAYIEKCIEGFLAQKTNFKFEICIHDDASTDNTPKIINRYKNKYPDLFNTILQQENQYSKNKAIITNIVLNYTKGKYTAFCEGDDFWTDPLKLQKQVDFLESNPDYGVVYANVNHLFQNKGLLKQKIYNDCPEGQIFENILKGLLPVVTQTVCCQTQLLINHFKEYKGNKDEQLFDIDLAVWLGLSLKTKFHYMDEVFATYRLSDESMSRSKDYTKRYHFHQKIAKIRFHYVRKYKDKLSQETRNKVYQMYYNSIFTDGSALKNKRMMYRGKKGLNTLGIKLSHKQSLLYYFPIIASLLSLLKTHVKLKTK